MRIDPARLIGIGSGASAADEDDTAPAPLAGTRREAIQRLQVGLSMLVGVVLLVALASVIDGRARDSEATTVPEAAPTVAATEDAQSDPLVDAGVVPDLPPATPAPEASQEAAIVPEQGGNAPVAPPAE